MNTNYKNTHQLELPLNFIKEEQKRYEQMLFEFKGIIPNYNISFFYNDVKVGELDWNDGIMKFKGNVDESAKIFFDQLIKTYNGK